MKPISKVTSTALVLDVQNIDTDQIIPARFLTTTQRAGLGKHAFNDWRYAEDGTEKTAGPLAQQSKQPRKILLGGVNFGCGSSREHAPWALLDYGFEAVISPRIADIFRSNSLKNGLLAIEVSAVFFQSLKAQADQEIAIDLESCTIRSGDGQTTQFEIDGFSRYCLLRGLDTLDYLLDAETEITQFEEKHACV